jgi:hypothetical protein
MRTRIILVSLALVFVLVAASGLSAQTFRGTILGTVSDPSGEECRHRPRAHD